MAQYFRLTYVRKQVITDFLGGKVMREVTNEITEVIGGLPAMTVANYRKVLGDQVVSVEPDESYGQSEPMPRGGVKSDVRGRRRQEIRKSVVGPAAEVEDPMGSTYAGLINKMVAKENAA